MRGCVFQGDQGPGRRAAWGRWWALIGFVGLAGLVPVSQAVSGYGAGMAGFVLYPVSGVAAWLVWRRVAVGVERKRAALRWWGWQLLVGGVWPVMLIGAPRGVAVVGLALVVGTAVAAFWRLQVGAAVLLGVYGVWLVGVAAMGANRL